MTGVEVGPGILFVLSAPSGTGKSTLARRLVDEDPAVVFSVSFTTRPRREGELDGREYHFVDERTFGDMETRNEFLEWAQVFGRRYGTGKEATRRILASGKDLLLDIDVQGARKIRTAGVPGVFLFILPPDYATLERRLRARRTESEADVVQRLSLARREGEEYPSYDYIMINDDLERTFEEIRAIVRAERCKVARRDARARHIMETFPRP
jgi:guanylate kinase